MPDAAVGLFFGVQVAQRVAQLQEALLHCGKFQDALEPLLSWLADTEELISNQKPPSAEYKVVKAQIQEQKVSEHWVDLWEGTSGQPDNILGVQLGCPCFFPGGSQFLTSQYNERFTHTQPSPSFKSPRPFVVLLPLEVGFGGRPGVFSGPEFCFVPIILLRQERAGGGAGPGLGVWTKGMLQSVRAGPRCARVC